jgi:hypothetical protein
MATPETSGLQFDLGTPLNQTMFLNNEGDISSLIKLGINQVVDEDYVKMTIGNLSGNVSSGKIIIKGIRL